MNDKVNEILQDLNKFHNNLKELEKTTSSCNEYMKCIKEERECIQNLNDENLSKIKEVQDELGNKINFLKNSIIEFVKDENKSSIEMYKTAIKSLDENKKFVEMSCNKYLDSINIQSDIMDVRLEQLDSEYEKITKLVTDIKNLEITKEINAFTKNNNRNFIIQIIFYAIITILLVINLFV